MTRQHLRIATCLLLLSTAASCALHKAAASTHGDAPASAAVPAAAAATAATASKPSATARAAQGVRFWRPAKAGEEYDLKVVAAEMTYSGEAAGGEGDAQHQQEAAADDSLGVQLEARVKVLEADDAGNPTKLTYAVRRAVRVAAGGKEQELLPAGRVVTVSVGEDGDTEYSLDRGDVSDEMRDALELATALPNGDAALDDVFGTDERPADGGAWAVNHALAVSTYQPEGVEFAKVEVSGRVKASGEEKVEGRAQVKVSGELDVKFSEPLRQPEDRPEGLDVVAGTTRVSLKAMVPVGKGASTAATTTRSQSWVSTTTYKGRPGTDAADSTATVTTRGASEVRVTRVR